MLPPAAGAASPLRLPTPEVFTLPNGLKVYLVEQHNLPLVSANVIILGGSDRNPVHRPGLSSFTAEMLDEGTRKRSTMDIARAAEKLGARLSTGSTVDYSYVSVRTLKRNVDAALELTADVLLSPAFPEAEIERVRHDRLTGIIQQRDDPSTVAGKAFLRAVYGAEHPYGFPEIGTEGSNRVATKAELEAFWRAVYFPRDAALVVAGDVTGGELRDLAEKHFGSWAGTGGAPGQPPPASARARRVVVVDRPELPQTVLRIGHVGVPRSHPDFIPIDVMNTALGGLFSSRINLNLREVHGYTYGASSAFASRRGAGPFIVATSVRADATAAAVTEILREIERMRTGELTAAELVTARESITRSLPGRFETTSQAASSIGKLFVHNLPLDYYRTLPERVDAVTAADALRVARQFLKPHELVIVAVGDRERILRDLEALGLGPTEEADPDGEPAAGTSNG